jgi:hypothetical protein
MNPKILQKVEEKLKLADYLLSQSSDAYAAGAAHHLLKASNILLQEILQTDKLSPQIVLNKLENSSGAEKEFASSYMTLWKTCSEKNPKKQTLIDIYRKIKEATEKLRDKYYDQVAEKYIGQGST